MAFIDHILQKPSYGWNTDKGELIIPTSRALFKEALSRINVFRSRKNWISGVGFCMILCMAPFLYRFLVHYFTWLSFFAFFIYAMIIMGVHGTVWFHRYCTHKAYKYSHPVWRFIVQNMVIRTIPEEIYAISHHVHHAKADKPGDPYNAKAGLLYCMFAEINHQSISKDLSEPDYQKVSGLLRHTGVSINSYKQYRFWGSVTSPFYIIAIWVFNWSFWYCALYLIGGAALACAIFSGAMFWLIFIRAFNYTGHGKGKDKHVDGLDFDRSNLAINQSRPGLFTGEWHNNHHLYPGSARAGFLPYQIDLSWIAIYCMYHLGMVSSYHDSKSDFLKKYRKVNLKSP